MVLHQVLVHKLSDIRRHYLHSPGTTREPPTPYCAAVSGMRRLVLTWRMVLPVRGILGLTSGRSCYCAATPCPVLTWRMGLPGADPHTVARAESFPVLSCAAAMRCAHMPTLSAVRCVVLRSLFSTFAPGRGTEMAKGAERCGTEIAYAPTAHTRSHLSLPTPRSLPSYALPTPCPVLT
eukprot:3814514-Rhodomonas_salina.1